MYYVSECNVDYTLGDLYAETGVVKGLVIACINQEWLTLKTLVETSLSDLDLKVRVRRIRFAHFYYGFGGHHFWVKQVLKSKDISSKNVFFVDFENQH